MDVRKLRDYSLATDNPRGSHKARVLFSALGITALDAEWLRDAILEALPSAKPEFVRSDTYGSRYSADLSITRLGRHCMLRTAWIVTGERSPATIYRLLGSLMLHKHERAQTKPKPLDVVELLVDAVEPGSAPWGGTVRAGSLGTVVDELADGHYIVEFGGEDGNLDTLMTLPERSLRLNWAS